ncbi:hypothetical protein FACS189426_02450 [Bacteroidia bacterium]|nr:hypothetical protein FACS189426_02450 [Bacteroidia bacterium]
MSKNPTGFCIANIGLAKWDAHLCYKAAFDSVQNLVVNETMLRAAEELEVKYETEKKEMQIATLEEEKQLMIWLSIATGAVLLLALAAFFFLWRWTVQKKRLAESQKELAEQEKQLADRQIKQLEQEKQLIATQAVLDGEIQERTRLARNLHDSLGSMLTRARMSIESLKNDALLGKTDIANFDSALKILNDSSHELRRIAHHLMPDALSRFGLKTSVSDFCDALSAVKFLWYGDDTRLNPKTEEIIEGIRTVSSGKRFLCEETDSVLKKGRDKQVILTRQERELLGLLAAGHTSKEIAEKMYLGYETVRSYRKNLQTKLSVHSTVELTRIALDRKLV